MDSDEHRRTLAPDEETHPFDPTGGNTTLELPPSQLRLVVPGWKDDEGPDQMP